MALATTQTTPLEPARRRAWVDTLRAAARHFSLLLIVGLVVGIHLPTMRYYFFGDDFLVLGDIQTRSFPHYMSDVFFLRDMTPNWRPLTMLAYWAEFKLFGFNALPWRIVNLTLHAATVVLLYRFVLSLTKRSFVALAAALIFGVSASAVHTVTYITAFPHVFSEFLLLASLVSLQQYVQSGERRAFWYWSSLTLFIAGFLANEGGVVLGGVLLAYFAIYSLLPRRDLLDFTIKMLPFALAATVLVSALSGCGCQGVDAGFYGVGWHIPREFWIYMSRLAYPVGAIRLEPTHIEWIWGSIVVACAIFFLIRGPHIARIAAVGMALGVMPYVPGKIWTASRYSYMSTPFFAILIAVGAGFVHHHAARLYKPGAHVLAAAALLAVGGLYSWQTLHQTQPFLHETNRWQLLTDELKANYESVPPGTTIYLIDDEGLWSNPYWQPTWMVSVGHALYGNGVALRALPSGDLARLKMSIVGDVYSLQLQDGHLTSASDQFNNQASEARR